MPSLSASDGLVAIVLAAGLSRRFVGDKLLAPLAGKPLAAHIADTLASMNLRARLAVCPGRNEERAALFKDRGFEIVWNDAPEEGMGHSLALAAIRARALAADAALVCLGDMPNITVAHLRRLIAAAQAGPVATEVDGVRMPPAIFPRAMFTDLSALTGDRGARSLLAAARTVRAEPPLELDIDTAADFG